MGGGAAGALEVLLEMEAWRGGVEAGRNGGWSRARVLPPSTHAHAFFLPPHHTACQRGRPDLRREARRNKRGERKGA